MKRTIYDPTSFGAPIDSTAARVTGKGTPDIDYSATDGQYHSHTPLPLGKPDRSQPQFVDYTGRRRGRLVVVGYVGGKGGNSGGARWLVQCECSMYEVRRSNALRNANMDDMCRRCAVLRHNNRQAHFDKHGRWPE